MRETTRGRRRGSGSGRHGFDAAGTIDEVATPTDTADARTGDSGGRSGRDDRGQLRRSVAGHASRGLFIAGLLILLGTVAVIAIGIVRHFSGVAGPVLPGSWCRDVAIAPLPPLSGLRWFTAWQLDGIAVVFLAAVAALYLSGVSAVTRQRRRWPLRHTVSFLAGLGVIALATCSSIAVYDMAMFSSHMLGHLLLVMVAPPLLVAGRPMTLAMHATRNPWHRRIRRVVRSRALALWSCPPVALAAYTVVIVGTHLTGLMNDIMTRPWAGQIEHLVYVLVGYQFFVSLIGDEPLRWRLSMPAKQLMLVLAMAVDTFTGVILLQSTRAISMMGSAPQHVDPLDETRLGGAIMWVGGDGIMVVVMIAIAIAWVRSPAHLRRMSNSWIEQTRRANLAEHAFTGIHAGHAETLRDIDEDDRAREAYNDWLAGLNGGVSSRPGR